MFCFEVFQHLVEGFDDMKTVSPESVVSCPKDSWLWFWITCVFSSLLLTIIVYHCQRIPEMPPRALVRPVGSIILNTTIVAVRANNRFKFR